MKKLTILLALLLSFTFSFAQKVYQITHIQLGTFNNISQKWEWSKTESTDFTLTLNGSAVTIDNKNQTTLLTYEYLGEENRIDEEGDSYRADKWYAYDQEKRKCIFTMMNYKNIKLTIYQIKYSDYIFRYYSNKEFNY
jgi:hypothetical protein